MGYYYLLIFIHDTVALQVISIICNKIYDKQPKNAPVNKTDVFLRTLLWKSPDFILRSSSL